LGARGTGVIKGAGKVMLGWVILGTIVTLVKVGDLQVDGTKMG